MYNQRLAVPVGEVDQVPTWKPIPSAGETEGVCRYQCTVCGTVLASFQDLVQHKNTECRIPSQPGDRLAAGMDRPPKHEKQATSCLGETPPVSDVNFTEVNGGVMLQQIPSVDELVPPLIPENEVQLQTSEPHERSEPGSSLLKQQGVFPKSESVLKSSCQHDEFQTEPSRVVPPSEMENNLSPPQASSVDVIPQGIGCNVPGDEPASEGTDSLLKQLLSTASCPFDVALDKPVAQSVGIGTHLCDRCAQTFSTQQDFSEHKCQFDAIENEHTTNKPYTSVPVASETNSVAAVNLDKSTERATSDTTAATSSSTWPLANENWQSSLLLPTTVAKTSNASMPVIEEKDKWESLYSSLKVMMPSKSANSKVAAKRRPLKNSAPAVAADNVVCKVCQQRFTTPEACRVHWYVYHSKPSTATSNTTTAPPQPHPTPNVVANPTNGVASYLCNLCQKRFVDRRAYAYHMEAHQQPQFDSCHVCHVSFQSIGDYFAHLGLANHVVTCGLCNRMFDSIGGLKVHTYRAHEWSSHVHCCKCKMAFPVKRLILQHLKVCRGHSPNVTAAVAAAVGSKPRNDGLPQTKNSTTGIPEKVQMWSPAERRVVNYLPGGATAGERAQTSQGGQIPRPPQEPLYRTLPNLIQEKHTNTPQGSSTATSGSYFSQPNRAPQKAPESKVQNIFIRCPTCDHRFTSADGYYLHLPKRSVTCCVCETKFDQVSAAIKHNLHNHNIRNGMFCCYCSRSCADVNLLRSHRLVCHENPRRLPPPPPYGILSTPSSSTSFKQTYMKSLATQLQASSLNLPEPKKNVKVVDPSQAVSGQPQVPFPRLTPFYPQNVGRPLIGFPQVQYPQANQRGISASYQRPPSFQQIPKVQPPNSNLLLRQTQLPMYLNQELENDGEYVVVKIPRSNLSTEPAVLDISVRAPNANADSGKNYRIQLPGRKTSQPVANNYFHVPMYIGEQYYAPGSSAGAAFGGVGMKTYEGAPDEQCYVGDDAQGSSCDPVAMLEAVYSDSSDDSVQILKQSSPKKVPKKKRVRKRQPKGSKGKHVVDLHVSLSKLSSAIKEKMAAAVPSLKLNQRSLKLLRSLPKCSVLLHRIEVFTHCACCKTVVPRRGNVNVCSACRQQKLMPAAVGPVLAPNVTSVVAMETAVVTPDNGQKKAVDFKPYEVRSKVQKVQWKVKFRKPKKVRHAAKNVRGKAKNVNLPSSEPSEVLSEAEVVAMSSEPKEVHCEAEETVSGGLEEVHCEPDVVVVSEPKDVHCEAEETVSGGLEEVHCEPDVVVISEPKEVHCEAEETVSGGLEKVHCEPHVVVVSEPKEVHCNAEETVSVGLEEVQCEPVLMVSSSGPKEVHCKGDDDVVMLYGGPKEMRHDAEEKKEVVGGHRSDEVHPRKRIRLKECRVVLHRLDDDVVNQQKRKK